MDETGDRLAHVSYLFGASDASAAPILTPEEHRAAWNDGWGDDIDDSCARLTDAETERISMTALGRRGLSRRELERVLRDKGVDDASVERECERLTRVGLLDDSALAQTLVGTLQERKGLGRSAIAAELARRLLAPSAIAYALELVDTGDELARAKEIAVKRAPQLGGLERDAAVRRLSSYLARRGYSGSTLRAAVDQALPPRTTNSSGVRFR